MELFVVVLAAFFASFLTLFSGFGLGTLLMPVVALFFPVEVAVAITAVVHLANNLFKVVLVAGKADKTILLRFGLPAVLSAFLGAWLLAWISSFGQSIHWTLLGEVRQVFLVKFIVGWLILLFVLLELMPAFKRARINQCYMPWGGVLSGFFGGLSGHQGAFRSMFLVKSGVDAQVFVGTSVMLAVMVDVARLTVYGADLWQQASAVQWDWVGAACVSAFSGAWLGARLLKKVTLALVQKMVSVLLVLIAAGMISGLL